MSTVVLASDSFFKKQ